MDLDLVDRVREFPHVPFQGGRLPRHQPPANRDGAYQSGHRWLCCLWLVADHIHVDVLDQRNAIPRVQYASPKSDHSIHRVEAHRRFNLHFCRVEWHRHGVVREVVKSATDCERAFPIPRWRCFRTRRRKILQVDHNLAPVSKTNNTRYARGRHASSGRHGGTKLLGGSPRDPLIKEELGRCLESQDVGVQAAWITLLFCICQYNTPPLKSSDFVYVDSIR